MFKFLSIRSLGIFKLYILFFIQQFAFIFVFVLKIVAIYIAINILDTRTADANVSVTHRFRAHSSLRGMESRNLKFCPLRNSIFIYQEPVAPYWESACKTGMPTAFNLHS